MHLNLTNKVALITGVSREAGIGAAIARAFAADGAQVMVTGATAAAAAAAA